MFKVEALDIERAFYSLNFAVNSWEVGRKLKINI